MRLCENRHGQVFFMNSRSGASTSQGNATVTDDRKYQRVSSPLFVVGVWRSGTTLLYALLNQHPDIRLFYEGDLAILWPMFRIPYGRKSWVEKWEYWNAGVSRHGLDPTRLTTPVASLAEAGELAGRQYTGSKGGTIWGCKSPSYYDRLIPLSREFPAARFIVIWRDPEEICRSITRAAAHAPWFARYGSSHRAIMACEQLKNQCDKLLAKGGCVYQIHYRDLVNNTSNTMKRICEFLGIPFTPAVAILEGADRSAVFEGDHHALARGNKIVFRRDPEGALSPAIATKVQRYKALWKAETGDNWLLCQHFSAVGEDKPGVWERAIDLSKFKMFCLIDSAPPFIYSILPRWVWQGYRFIKYRDAQFVHRQLTKKRSTLGSSIVR